MRLLFPLFAGTMFLSAFLLFLIQPMMGKVVLPWFGGTPTVWNSCMVFFQMVLLAGYFYSFGLTRWVPFRLQPWIHAAILGTGWFFFPICRSAPDQALLSGNPVVWVVGFLAANVGWQFFALSTTAPLLQSWFGQTSSEQARDPYFLYAASNAGSLIGLLGYPLFIEPHFTLARQADLFFLSYMVLAGLVFLTGSFSWWARRQSQEEERDLAFPILDQASGSNRWALRFWWLFCSFVPSTLLLGLTTHLSTNVASFPLLWVIPLALYLLTFIFAFSRTRFGDVHWAQRAFPYLALLLLPSFYRSEFVPLRLDMALHLTFFFCAAMVCHGRLASLRPDRMRLTEFYLLMSVGGALGGMFNSFFAPFWFSGVHEYPIAIFLVCLCLPLRDQESGNPDLRPGNESFPVTRKDVLHPLALGLSGIVLVYGLKAVGIDPNMVILFAAILVTGSVVCFSFQRFPLRFGLGWLVVLTILVLVQRIDGDRVLHAERNFFGVKRIVLDKGGSLVLLYHGDTLHGSQRVDERTHPTPLAYYHSSSPIGECMRFFQARQQPMRIGVVGLGVGSLAAYSWESSYFTFFEIDPAVERLARDTRYFTFLSGARGKWDIVLGDGRLTLAGCPPNTFDLIILDAYSSDAIPVNLLTREALQLYFSRLTPRGFLAFHISNRHLRLAPLVGKLAADQGAVAFQNDNASFSTSKVSAPGCNPSHWAILAKDEANVKFLERFEGWKPLPGDAPFPAWTDDFSNILSLL